MNRNHFIKQTSLLTAGLACSPSLLFSREGEEIILGHNNKRYRIDTKWGELDRNRYPVKDCHEMVQDVYKRQADERPHQVDVILWAQT